MPTNSIQMRVTLPPGPITGEKEEAAPNGGGLSSVRANQVALAAN